MASMLVLASMVAVTACSPGRAAPADDGGAGGGTSTTEAASRLELVDETNEVYCDSTERVIGSVQGAEPGERIELSSPVPIQLTADQANATADASGSYRLTWRCGPSEAGQPWELNVRGRDSGRWVTVFFVGTAFDPEFVDKLQVDLVDDTVVCDGRSTTVGELFNASAFEAVTFTDESAGKLRDQVTNSEGGLELTWQCWPDEATTWVVTVEGLQSERVGAFTLVGVAPPPDEQAPTVRFDEHPIVCDGGSRVFATLSGFWSNEIVDFASPQARNIRQGQADEDGNLPVRWTCDPDEAGTGWELTATGARSGRAVTFTLTAADAPPPPQPAVTLTENPFACDDTTRFVAAISGFTSREYVDFASPQAPNLRQGQADGTGGLQVRWTCGADDVGKVWEITATGATSQRSASFQITGAAPAG